MTLYLTLTASIVSSWLAIAMLIYYLYPSVMIRFIMRIIRQSAKGIPVFMDQFEDLAIDVLDSLDELPDFDAISKRIDDALVERAHA